MNQAKPQLRIDSFQLPERGRGARFPQAEASWPGQQATTGHKVGTVRLVPVRYAGDRDYGEPPSTRPTRTAQTTICCLVLKPSFLWTPDTALRTVSPLLFRISPISW